MRAQVSRRDLPRGGLHAAEDDVSAGQGRLFAVLHLLHLAQHQGGTNRVPYRTDDHGRERVLPAALLRQHARHQSLFPADLRPPRLPHPRRAGRDAVRPMGRLFGFELCEAAPLPEREEYLDSEKYEIRVRDDNAPGNIVAEITALNRIRKANPALQSHLGVKFYNAFNDQVLLYGKATPALDDMILVAVSLDPHHVQEADFEIPLWEWKLPDSGSLSGRGPDARTRVPCGPASASACGSIRPSCRSRSGASSPQPEGAMNAPLAQVTVLTARGSALVQGRDHLSAAREVVLRRQQRRHRRFSRPDRQARLHRRARRQRDLAAAVLSLAAPR